MLGIFGLFKIIFSLFYLLYVIYISSSLPNNRAAIHYPLVILSLSSLETTLKQKKMMTKSHYWKALFHTLKIKCYYCLTCLGCNENYIGRTHRNLVTLLLEHDLRKDQPMHDQLLEYKHIIGIANLMRLPDIHSVSTSVVKKCYLLNVVLSNVHLVNSCRN